MSSWDNVLTLWRIKKIGSFVKGWIKHHFFGIFIKKGTFDFQIFPSSFVQSPYTNHFCLIPIKSSTLACFPPTTAYHVANRLIKKTPTHVVSKSAKQRYSRDSFESCTHTLFSRYKSPGRRVCAHTHHVQRGRAHTWLLQRASRDTSSLSSSPEKLDASRTCICIYIHTGGGSREAGV